MPGQRLYGNRLAALFGAGGRDDRGSRPGPLRNFFAEYLAARESVPGPEGGRPRAEQRVDEVLAMFVGGVPLG
ncbi:hypothetical protein [Streptomyces shaanxiensis]